jgi:hypothetical protein
MGKPATNDSLGACRVRVKSPSFCRRRVFESVAYSKLTSHSGGAKFLAYAKYLAFNRHRYYSARAFQVHVLVAVHSHKSSPRKDWAMKYFLQAESSPSAHKFAAVLWSLVWMPVRRMTTVIAFITALGACHAESQTVDQEAAGTSQCLVRIRRAMGEAGAGQLAEADAELVIALTKVDSITDSAYAGLILHNRAAIASISGRFEDGELAISAIAALEKVYPQDHLALLRPLLVLASTRLERGNRSGARLAFSRIKRINADQPNERAMIHAMSGSLLHSMGERMQAEAEYLAALDTWMKLGRGETADAAAVITSIGGAVHSGTTVRKRRSDRSTMLRQFFRRPTMLLRRTTLTSLLFGVCCMPGGANGRQPKETFPRD